MRTRILFMMVASFVWMSLFQSAIAQRTNATPILTLLDPGFFAEFSGWIYGIAGCRSSFPQ